MPTARIAGLLFVAALLAALDLLPLIRERRWREVALFSLLTGLGLLLGLALILPDHPTSGYRILAGAKEALSSFFRR
ncbi:MAG: hypothetical protein HYY09_09020 [Firmicutes bacterium]|nr:hypothetical protein [Bacillota bacterium]